MHCVHLTPAHHAGGLVGAFLDPSSSAKFGPRVAARNAARVERGGERELDKLGLRRHMALAVPHFPVAPHLIAWSDLVLTLPERVARLVTSPLGLVIREPPAELALPIYDIRDLARALSHHHRVPTGARAHCPRRIGDGRAVGRDSWVTPSRRGPQDRAEHAPRAWCSPKATPGTGEREASPGGDENFSSHRARSVSTT